MAVMYVGKDYCDTSPWHPPLPNLKPFFCNSTKAERDEFYVNSVIVIGEFGGDNYNASLFAGEGLEEAYKFMADVI
uniref:Uncharacterized protein n=1 Tax=Oryza meridionalis TaxID=40149 RepID=A0A0E0EDX4_9ORYZ